MEEGPTHATKGQIRDQSMHEDVVGCHATAGGLRYHPSDQLPRMRDGTEQREIKTGHEHHGFTRAGGCQGDACVSL